MVLKSLQKNVAIHFYDKTGLNQEDMSVCSKCKAGSKKGN